VRIGEAILGGLGSLGGDVGGVVSFLRDGGDVVAGSRLGGVADASRLVCVCELKIRF
jgi:hypothetical protein